MAARLVAALQEVASHRGNQLSRTGAALLEVFGKCQPAQGDASSPAAPPQRAAPKLAKLVVATSQPSTSSALADDSEAAYFRAVRNAKELEEALRRDESGEAHSAQATATGPEQLLRDMDEVEVGSRARILRAAPKSGSRAELQGPPSPAPEDARRSEVLLPSSEQLPRAALGLGAGTPVSEPAAAPSTGGRRGVACPEGHAYCDTSATPICHKCGDGAEFENFWFTQRDGTRAKCLRCGACTCPEHRRTDLGRSLVDDPPNCPQS